MSHGAGAYQCAAHAHWRSEGRRGRLKEQDQRSRWHSQSEVWMVQISMGPLDFHHEIEKLALKLRSCALKANR